MHVACLGFYTFVFKVLILMGDAGHGIAATNDGCYSIGLRSKIVDKA